MSATTDRLPISEEHPVPDRGFPAVEEFKRVWDTLSIVQEFGLDQLFEAVAQQLVDGYEDVDGAEPATYEQLGILSARADLIVEISDSVRATARKLQELRADFGDAAWHGGKLYEAPRYSRYGGDYEPSKEAFERWGLRTASAS